MTTHAERKPGTSGPNDTRRWPRPTPILFGLLLVWLAGIVVSTVVPWTIVAPTETDPDHAAVWTAAAVSAGGVLLFSAAGIAAYVNSKNMSILTWALIPGVSIGAGVLIFTATLLSI